MSWQTWLNGNPLPWLLEDDGSGVAYPAMRDLLDAASDDAELVSAQLKAHRQGPIATVLAGMNDAGYWSKPGPGYGPKYRSTVWSLILLAQLGAKAACDERISRACAYLLDHALAPGGQFSYNGTVTGTFDCLQGNLCAAMIDLGCDDPRLEKAFEWMARSVTGEGVAPASDRDAEIRYSRYKCGPGFACGANNRLPCAWGAVKVILASSRLAEERQTPLIKRAIDQGIAFLFSTDPALAAYPSGNNNRPSAKWWKFGFPVFYVTDLLQNVDALVRMGYGGDPRLAGALNLILEKQDSHGRWKLEYHYNNKTWGNYGRKSQPNKWVTLRALRVLKRVAETGAVMLPGF